MLMLYLLGIPAAIAAVFLFFMFGPSVMYDWISPYGKKD